MSANISVPQLRKKLDALFVVVTNLTQELATIKALAVTGAATVGGTLGVTGATTLASVGVTGAATVGTTLGVTGATTLSDALSTAGVIFAVKTKTFSDTTAWTLSAAEQKATYLSASGTTGGATDVIATPTLGKIYILFNNGTGSNLTIKASGQTGVAVATTKTVVVIGNGTDFVEIVSKA